MIYYAKLENIFNKFSLYLIYFLLRYKSSKPVKVIVLEGIPTIHNFTLSRTEVSNEQGNDIDYPQISLFNNFLAPYEMIIDYNN